MDSATQTPIYSTADHHRQPPNINSDINNHQDSLNQPSKLPMFEKLLTPSDVGKLNRLVIPKQHAEKHFPVHAGDQRGLLLGFEDETGKPWRFRYCYWNSSQSYVLTKGWSRYVKEKRLNAGDVVLFERDRLDGDRLFIGWRRRSAAVAPPVSTGSVQVNRWAMKVSDAQYSYPSHHGQHIHLSVPNPCRHAGNAGGANDNVGNNKSYSGNARRVRLFGVNLECPDEYEPSTQDGSSQGGQPQSQYSSGSNNLISNNMNINFSQLRDHQHQE